MLSCVGKISIQLCEGGAIPYVSTIAKIKAEELHCIKIVLPLWQSTLIVIQFEPLLREAFALHLRYICTRFALHLHEICTTFALHLHEMPVNRDALSGSNTVPVGMERFAINPLGLLKLV